MKDQLKHGLYLQNGPAYLKELLKPSYAVEYATAAEEAGWDAVFMADAFGEEETFFDPIVTHSAIAEATDEIKLGTWITPIPRRQPWQVALDFATLDEISDGRVIIGTGMGAPWNYQSTGIEYEPTKLGDRYDEALEIIDKLWTGETVSFSGDYFEINEMELPITPIQEPRIPIMNGFWWPNKLPLHRAANWDGIMPYAPSFYGQEGIQGEPVTGSMVEEITDIIAYYEDVADEPGDILIPIDVPGAPDDIVERCDSLGVTWTLTTTLLTDEAHATNLDRISDGPPGTP